MSLKTTTQDSIKSFVEWCSPTEASPQFQAQKSSIRESHYIALKLLQYDELRTLLSYPTIKGQKNASTLEQRIDHYFPNPIESKTKELVKAICRKNEQLYGQKGIHILDLCFNKKEISSYLIDQIIESKTYEYTGDNKEALKPVKNSEIVKKGLCKRYFSPTAWADIITACLVTGIVSTCAGIIPIYIESFIGLFTKIPAYISLLSGLAVSLLAYLIPALTHKLIVKWRCHMDAKRQTELYDHLLIKDHRHLQHLNDFKTATELNNAQSFAEYSQKLNNYSNLSTPTLETDMDNDNLI